MYKACFMPCRNEVAKLASTLKQQRFAMHKDGDGDDEQRHDEQRHDAGHDEIHG